MNKRQKEVLQSQLDSEKKVLKELEKQYQSALDEINDKIRLLQSKTVYDSDGIGRNEQVPLDQLPQSRIYQIEHQKALKGQIEGIVEKLHSDQYETIQQYLEDSYVNAFVGTAYDIAGQGIPLIMPIDQAAAIKAIQTDSKISEGLYAALGVDTKGLKKAIAQEATRGIASGLTFNDIARNIQNVSKVPLSNAKRIARTEGHRIEQASAFDAQNAAKAKGADVVKQWDSTLDGRTRPTHRKLDGQIREVKEPFKMDGKSAMYPGGFGDPAEDCNCRCASLTRARWGLDEDELKLLQQRAEYFGLSEEKAQTFNEFRITYLEAANSSANKMAAQSQRNDWSKTKARKVSSEEKQAVIRYAEDRGIEIGDISTFDGDTELLKSGIDTISRTCKEYGISSKITVSSRVLEDDSDFALTDGHTITFNSKALRDRKVTEYNITNSKRFASKTVEDIALHEIGHIIAQEKGVNGIEISKKAYYNVTGKYASPGFLRKFLTSEVSLYSTEDDDEIVAEVIVGNKNKPTEFTKTFVLLMNGEVPNEST